MFKPECSSHWLYLPLWY